MHIQRLGEFVLEELGLLLVFEQLLLQEVELTVQVRQAVCLILRVLDYALQLLYLFDQLQNIVGFVLEVDASLPQSRLLDLDLLVQQEQFFVALYQLRAQNVALIYYHLVVFFLLAFLVLRFRYHILQSRNVRFLGFDHLVGRGNLLLDVFCLVLAELVLFLVHFFLAVLLLVLLVLARDFLFQLRQLL